MNRSFLLVLTLACLAPLQSRPLAAEPAAKSAMPVKKVVKTAADLPTFTYKVPAQLDILLTSDTAWAPFAQTLRANLEGMLRDYAIEDRKTRQLIETDLLLLDLDQDKAADAQARIARVIELEDKPDAKAFSPEPFMAAVILQARKASGAREGAAYHAALAAAFAQHLARLPDSASTGVARIRSVYEMAPPDLALTALNAELAPLAKTGGNTLAPDGARQVLWMRTLHRLLLPTAPEMLPAFAAHLVAHPVQIVDIWAERGVVLQEESALTPVTIAIWDTGVDATQFPGRLYVNPKEKDNGKDNDGNGFVADVHGIAFDLNNRRVTDMIAPAAAADRAQFPRLIQENRALGELKNGIDNERTRALKAKLQGMTPEQMADESRLLEEFMNYWHGTAVAAIAAAGNPGARLLNARLISANNQFGKPRVIYDRDWAKGFAASVRDSVAYFKSQRVRVVNMSWALTTKEIADNLRRAGAVTSEAEAARVAGESFEVIRVALTKAFQGAPDILFVAAAGNSDDDASFQQSVPGSIEVPNLLTVGAVDKTGAAAGFTSFGKNVTLYASGVELDVPIPGGARIVESGTSFASPQVANLAAKLIARNPQLGVADVVALIRDGATAGEDERLQLIHPKRSLALSANR